MATSSTPPSLFPGQQQAAGSTANAIPEAAATRSGGSGSIGPFLGVISVVIVLSILSCVLGRRCARRQSSCCCGGGVEESPLASIEGSSWTRWLRRKWRRCLAGEVEAGAKVADCAGEGGDHGKVVKDVEAQRP